MTFISWSLEFIAGLTYLPVRFMKIRWVVSWLVILDIVLNFILIPMSFVFNNDVNKAIIVAHGWVQWFRRLINRGPIVAPKQQDEEENPPNPNPIPAPIPTISGNIDALENRGNTHGNGLPRATSSGFMSQQLYPVENTIENVPTTEHIDRSESDQTSPNEVTQIPSNDAVELDDDEDQIETIIL